MSPELQAILNLLSNLAALANTPAGQQLLSRLSGKNGLTPAELHASIGQLPEPTPPKGAGQQEE